MFTRLMAGVSLIPLRSPSEEGGGGDPPPAAAPAAEPPAPAAEPPSAAEPPAAPAAESPAPVDEPKPARVPWQVKRIDQLTATAKQEREAREAAEARAAEAERRAAAFESLYGKSGDPPPAPTTDGPARPAPGTPDWDRAVQAEAARVANTTRLNEKLDNIFETGASKHGAGWNERINQAGQAFGRELVQRGDFFEALTSLPNPEDVYFALTGDLDHLAEVLAMPPARLGIELATMSQKAAAKPRGPALSGAPAPIEPINGQGSAEPDLAKVDMAEYTRIREAQRAARYKARNG